MKEEKKQKRSLVEGTSIAPSSRESSEAPEQAKPALVAKKNFMISHNEYVRHIKVGEDISDVPAHYHGNLRTEGVL